MFAVVWLLNRNLPCRGRYEAWVGRLGVAGLLSVVTLGCDRATGAGARGERLVVPGTELAAALVVDLERRAVVRSVGPPLAEGGPAAMGRGDTLIMIGQLDSQEWVLLGLDIRKGREAWRTQLADPGSAVDGVILGRDLLAVDPVLPTVYLWQSLSNGIPGIAAYNYRQRRVTAFYGPITRVRAITVVPSTPSCLVIAGDAGAGAGARTFLYFVCGGRSYAERDSLIFRFPSVLMEDVQWLPGGSSVLAASNGELMTVDVVTRSVTGRVPRPIAGLLITSPFDGRIFVADRGSATTASSGLIAVLTAALELYAIMDLHVLTSDLRPLGLYGGVVGGEGKLLYLVAGVGRSGPLYGPQQTYLLLLDTATGRARDIVFLGTLGGGRPFLVR